MIRNYNLVKRCFDQAQILMIRNYKNDHYIEGCCVVFTPTDVIFLKGSNSRYTTESHETENMLKLTLVGKVIFNNVIFVDIFLW